MAADIRSVSLRGNDEGLLGKLNQADRFLVRNFPVSRPAASRPARLTSIVSQSATGLPATTKPMSNAPATIVSPP
jgi:hypothetical protein